AALLLLAVPAAAHASAREETTFQDDDLLVFGSAATQARTLDTIRALGADRVRVSVFWNAIAPDAKSKTRPGFDATDPAAYPPGNWARYDRLVRLAAARGLGLNFDLTGPAPLWATGKPERADIEATYAPSAAEFGAFVTAVARRYSGDYTPPAPPAPAPAPDDGGGVVIPPPPVARAAQAPSETGPLPRVGYWAIWNEPNHPGWLTPQWTRDQNSRERGSPAPSGAGNRAATAGAGRWSEAAPRIYRGLADAAWGALQGTGHGRDTILVGETATKGLVTRRGTTRGIDPLRFIRALYC